MIRDDVHLPGHAGTGINPTNESVNVLPGYYRMEAIPMAKILPSIVPPVLYAWGALSPISGGTDPRLSPRLTEYVESYHTALCRRFMLTWTFQVSSVVS